MYLMVETVRVQTEDDRPEWRAAREAFKNELGVCVCLLNEHKAQGGSIPSEMCTLLIKLCAQTHVCIMQNKQILHQY